MSKETYNLYRNLPIPPTPHRFRIIDSNKINDEVLSHLAGLSALQKLGLRGCRQITNAGIDVLTDFIDGDKFSVPRRLDIYKD